MHDTLCVAGKPVGSAPRAILCQNRPPRLTPDLRRNVRFSLGKPFWVWSGTALAALLVGMGNPVTAAAEQITGSIGFGGAFKPADSSFASASWASATSIDFNGNGIKDSANELVVLATGDFAPAAFSFASLSDFTFSPSLPSGGVNPLWSVGGFSFALDSIFIDSQTANGLSLVGTGTVSGNNFAASPGTWNFIGGPIGTSTFLFLAGTGTVAAVPEPEIYAMMGVGLGLIGWIGRRKKLAKSAAA